jgi:hypothetical protein
MQKGQLCLFDAHVIFRLLGLYVYRALSEPYRRTDRFRQSGCAAAFNGKIRVGDSYAAAALMEA